MKRALFLIRRMLILLVLPVAMLVPAATAFAVATAVTVEGFKPDDPVVLTKDDDPTVKVEGRASNTGTFTFQLGQWNLPPGSSVRVRVVGGESKVIPSLADGSSTRDFRFPDRGAYTGKAPDHGFSITLQPVFDWQKKPRAGIGTVFPTGVTPGHEKFQLKSENRLQWTVPEVRLGGNIFNEQVEAGFKYFQDDAKSSATEPIGGDNVAITFHKPFSGSNGIGLGATGMDAKLDVKYQALDTFFGLPRGCSNAKSTISRYRSDPGWSAAGTGWTSAASCGVCHSTSPRRPTKTSSNFTAALESAFKRS